MDKYIHGNEGKMGEWYLKYSQLSAPSSKVSSEATLLISSPLFVSSSSFDILSLLKTDSLSLKPTDGAATKPSYRRQLSLAPLVLKTTLFCLRSKKPQTHHKKKTKKLTTRNLKSQIPTNTAGEAIPNHDAINPKSQIAETPKLIQRNGTQKASS
ncbi:KLRAQ motif-containing protein 1-like protein [Corchorus olitorius]|uniref:KLRAQ motif-containing protein 1-like protein n=1 Tax=Corchorus olitorius TaxID=93759 RepID=A0A1R3KSL4_9ROSI|nr:KLRAQ motif-containing protein 1-like protein [Corchorus olitorius]